MANYDVNYRNSAALAVMKLHEGGTLQIQDSNDEVLAELNVTSGIFESKGSGKAGLSNELSSTVLKSGNASKFVATLAGGGTETGTITPPAGGGDMTMNDLELVQGGIATILTWDATWPSSL